MKRWAYGLLCVMVIICSTGLGVITYQAALTQEMELNNVAKAIENADWYVPPGDTYKWLSAVDQNKNLLCGMDSQGREVLFDWRGKVIARLDVDVSDVYDAGDGMIVFENQKGKKGYLNEQGEVVIPAKFKEAYAFQGGYAAAEIKNPETGYNQRAPIDKKGNILYDTEAVDEWGKRYNAVQIRGRYFLMEPQNFDIPSKIYDVKSKKFVKEFNEDKSNLHIVDAGADRYLYGFNSDGHNTYALMDEQFERIEGEHTFLYIDKFSEGLSYAKWKEGKKHCSGYIDADGNVKIQLEDALYGGKFAEGKAMVWAADKLYVINADGEKLFEKKLKKSIEEEPFRQDSYDFDGDPGWQISDCWYRNGMAVCFDGSQYGLIDKEGNWTFEPFFDALAFAGKDAVIVNIDGKTGILKAGELYD